MAFICDSSGDYGSHTIHRPQIFYSLSRSKSPATPNLTPVTRKPCRAESLPTSTSGTASLVKNTKKLQIDATPSQPAPKVKLKVEPDVPDQIEAALNRNASGGDLDSDVGEQPDHNSDTNPHPSVENH